MTKKVLLLTSKFTKQHKNNSRYYIIKHAVHVAALDYELLSLLQCTEIFEQYILL